MLEEEQLISSRVGEDAGSEQRGRLVAAVLDGAVPRAPDVHGRWVSSVCSPRLSALVASLSTGLLFCRGHKAVKVFFVQVLTARLLNREMTCVSLSTASASCSPWGFDRRSGGVFPALSL